LDFRLDFRLAFRLTFRLTLDCVLKVSTIQSKIKPNTLVLSFYYI
jgi:hypothetical protein